MVPHDDFHTPRADPPRLLHGVEKATFHLHSLEQERFGGLLRDLTYQITAGYSWEEVEGVSYDQFIAALVEAGRAELITHLSSTRSPEDVTRVQQAFRVAHEEHLETKRDEGVAYILHPLRVALLLVEELGIDDPDMLCAALLHDVVEDTNFSLIRIETLFGTRVRILVEALSKGADESFEDYLTRLSECDDKGAALIKGADRVDNVRSLIFLTTMERRLSCINETERLLIPFVAVNAPELLPLLRRELDRATVLVREVELYPESFHTSLRRSSLPLHDALADLPVSKQVMSEAVTVDDYIRFLKASLGMVSCLENALRLGSELSPFGSDHIMHVARAPLILADLEALSSPVSDLSRSEEGYRIPPPKTPEDFAALLYVLEGATVGDVVIRAHIESHLGLSKECGASSLYPYGDEKETWRRFAKLLVAMETHCCAGDLDEKKLHVSVSKLLSSLLVGYRQY